MYIRRPHHQQVRNMDESGETIEVPDATLAEPCALVEEKRQETEALADMDDETGEHFLEE